MFTKNIKNPVLKQIAEWALAIAIAFFAFYLVDNFIAKTARVYGGSMETTYFHNDRVVVNRTAFWFREPRFGEIIAFPYAADPSQNYIKRVAGVPGDVIDIIAGNLYRNDQRLYCEHFSGLGNVFSGTVMFPMTIEEDRFFVLGDNLPISQDSRFVEVGNVYIGDIIGRVHFRWFPFADFGRVQ